MSRFEGVACTATYELALDQVEPVVQQLAALAVDAFVFDNTATPTIRASIEEACRRYGVAYLSNGRNDGTAIALNACLARAGQLGRVWCYYLDQDSRVDSSASDRLNETARALEADSSVALVGSGLDLADVTTTQPTSVDEGPRETRYVIASGTLMHVPSLVLVDGFDEGLRLDGVDHELCLRLRTSGFRLLVDERRRIAHAIGADAREVLPRRHFRVSRHPLWRRRLMWRNTTIIARRYIWRAPVDVLRLGLGRVLDTLLGAVTYREPRYLVAALQGLFDGLVPDIRRVGLSESASRDLLP